MFRQVDQVDRHTRGIVLSKLFTYGYVADLLDVPIEVIRRAVDIGELPFVEYKGHRRIEAKSITKLVKRHRKRHSYHYNKTPDGFDWSPTAFTAYIRRDELRIVDHKGDVVSVPFKGVAVC